MTSKRKRPTEDRALDRIIRASEHHLPIGYPGRATGTDEPAMKAKSLDRTPQIRVVPPKEGRLLLTKVIGPGVSTFLVSLISLRETTPGNTPEEVDATDLTMEDLSELDLC